MLDKETKQRLKVDYTQGILTESMLCVKYNIGPDVLQHIIQVGDGEEGFPLPWAPPFQKGRSAEGKKMRAVAEMAQTKLTPDEQFLSPHDQNALLTHEERESAAALPPAELEYANLILRGVTAPAAAIHAFGMDSMLEAQRRVAQLSRNLDIRRYMSAMRGKSTLAVVRDRAWAESVLHRVVDRCMTLEQSYTRKGEIIPGQCEFDAKGAVSALMLLMRLKGWDKETSDTAHEPQHERIKRLASQGRVLEGELVSGSKLHNK